MPAAVAQFESSTNKETSREKCNLNALARDRRPACLYNSTQTENETLEGICCYDRELSVSVS